MERARVVKMADRGGCIEVHWAVKVVKVLEGGRIYSASSSERVL